MQFEVISVVTLFSKLLQTAISKGCPDFSHAGVTSRMHLDEQNRDAWEGSCSHPAAPEVRDKTKPLFSQQQNTGNYF